MLSISKTQKAALQLNDATWVPNLCSHLRDYHSTAVSGLKDDELSMQVAKGLEKARTYGFREPSSIAFFIALLFEIGPEFDESPRIQEIMNGEGTPDERLYELVPTQKPKPEPMDVSADEPVEESTPQLPQESTKEPVVSTVEWQGEAEWEPVWTQAAKASPPKSDSKYMDIVANAADGAHGFRDPKIVKSCAPQPKKLENVSALFIPFEAVGTHYKRNAENGVLGFTTVQGDDGTTLERPSEKSGESSFTASGEQIAKLDIKGLLPDIVKAECENIRLQYSNEPSREAVENRYKDHPVFKTRPELTEQQRKDLFTKFVNGQMGYQHYPTILILSENPTKIKGQDPKSKKPKPKELRDDFPTKIDTGESGVVYVQELALDKSEVAGIAAVNEMAVYVREDFKKRAQESGELSITTEALTRFKTDQPNNGAAKKDEYMVKVTISRPGYSPSSLLGVHLRATLTGVKTQAKLQEEIESLDKFCKKNKIDVVVGDFNFDVGVSPKGFRGVYTESGADERAKQVEYWTPYEPLSAASSNKVVPMASSVASFPQSYSSSNNENFYMGIYLANPDNVRLTGPGVIALQGASGARSLPKGKRKKPRYYSDHGSMFFEVEQAPMPIVGVGEKRKRPSCEDESEHDESEDELPALKKPKL